MRGIIALTFILFSSALFANVQQRISFFTQQSSLFKQICYLPDGTFLEDRILFDAGSSIHDTAIDCNAQALALREEFQTINDYVESGQCPVDQRVDDQGLVDLLNGNSPIVEELACPGIGSAQDCSSQIACNIGRSIFPAGMAAARYLSSHPVLSSCDGTGSCFSNIGKAIFDNLWDTVKGLYNLGSMAANWVGDKIGSLWNSEDATSRRGIAATEATDSELDRFMNDPFGYIYETGSRFVNMIIEGISSRYGCSEWTGVPHLSECKKPMSFECANCNEKLNMVCGVAGYVGANLISNFFTGGTVAAAQIGGKIAASATFSVVRSVPGAARIMESMGRAGRLSRGAALIGNSIKNAWAAVKNSRTVQGVIATSSRINQAARKKVFLYAPSQDGIIALARGYNRLTLGAFQAGYRSTHQAAEATRGFLYSQYPKLSDINSGRYANVSTPEQYLREATRDMASADRTHMGIRVTTDANNQRRVIVYDRRPGTTESSIRFDFTTQGSSAAAVAVAAPRLRAVEQVTEEIQEIVVTASRRPASARVNSREDFVQTWGREVATTPAQNQRFIDQAVLAEREGVFFLDTQNSALKRLNDTLKDKGLIDAFGNRYNSLVQETLERFRAKYPGIQIDLYSDYKSLRAAIRGPPGKETELMTELGQMMDQTSSVFLAELRASNLVEGTLANEQWFRSGLGRTADEANLVTRFSRRSDDTISGQFNQIGVQTRIRMAWQNADLSRKSISTKYADSPLMRRIEGSDQSVLRAEVFEVVRKNSDPQDVARILSARYNRQVSTEDAQLFRQYFEQVDQFSPGLMIASRAEHNLDNAVHGGISIDFAGVGSFNAEATAIGLASGQTLRQSVTQIRSQELLITRDLDALKSRTESAIRETLGRHNITAEISVSGDDMMVVPSRALTPEIRREIAEAQVAAQAGSTTLPSGMRTSFFREGIPDEMARSVQATIGESVEKKLRARLEGQLTPEELRQTLFAVDMRGTTPGTGSVGLEIVNPNLGPASRQVIERELRGAIEDVNRDLRSTGAVGSLGNEGAFIFKKPLLLWEQIQLREFPWMSSSSTGSLSLAM